MNKKEMKSAHTKEKLCDAFITLYKEKTIEKISVKEITDMAGYNRATFYLYYKDIYDLLESIENRLLRFFEANVDRLLEKTMGSLDLETFDFLKVISELYYSNEKEFPVLMIRDLKFRNEVKKMAKQVISYKQSPCSPEDDNEIEYMIEYQLSAVIGILNMWVLKNKDIPFEELSKLIFRISTTGVLASMKKKLNP